MNDFDLEEINETSNKVLSVLLKKYKDVENKGDRNTIILNVLTGAIKNLLRKGIDERFLAEVIICIQQTLANDLLVTMKESVVNEND